MGVIRLFLISFLATFLASQLIGISFATGYTTPGGGTMIQAMPPGASAAVSVTGYFHDIGESTSDCNYNGAEGPCLIYMPPQPNGNPTPCPGTSGSSVSIQSAFSDPVCGGSSPYTIPSSGCVGIISSRLRCVGYQNPPNPAGTCTNTYYSSDVTPAGGGTYTACGYYTDFSGAGCTSNCYHTHIVSSYPVYFTVNAIVPPTVPYGNAANVFANPQQFNLGDAPTFSMYSTLVFPFLGNNFHLPICNSGDYCVTEVANIMSTGGCVDPLGTAQSTCSYGPVASSCVIKTTANIFQSGSRTFYNQTFNTAYMSPGNYVVCSYDFFTALGRRVAAIYATMNMICSGGTCNTNGVPPPSYTVTLPTPSYPSGCDSPSGCGWGTSGGSLAPTGSIAGYISTLCTIYTDITAVFGILAIILILVGAVLYMGSYSMPAQTAGTIRGYAQGLLIAGVVSGIIVAAGISLIYIAMGQPSGNMIGSCQVT